MNILYIFFKQCKLNNLFPLQQFIAPHLACYFKLHFGHLYLYNDCVLTILNVYTCNTHSLRFGLKK